MSKQIKMLVFALTAMLLISAGSVVLAKEEPITEDVQIQTTDNSTSAEPMLLANEETEEDETVAAEDLDIKEPKLLPDSKWYFLKDWSRSIRSFFTFNKVKKAELKLKYASERLLETRKLALQNKKSEIIEKAAAKYQEAVEAVKQAVDKIKDNASTSPAVDKFFNKFIQKEALHMRILEKLSTKNMATSTIEKITNAKNAQLIRFKEIMLKLEASKERISERLEENIEKLKQQWPNKAAVRNRLENIKNRMIEKITGLVKPVCANLWEPICGVDGKTYTNQCWAEQAKIEIAEQGICPGSIVPNTEKQTKYQLTLKLIQAVNPEKYPLTLPCTASIFPIKNGKKTNEKIATEEVEQNSANPQEGIVTFILPTGNYSYEAICYNFPLEGYGTINLTSNREKTLMLDISPDEEQDE